MLLLILISVLQGYSQQSLNIGVSYGQRLNYRHSTFVSVAGITATYSAPISPSTHVRLTTGIEGTDPGSSIATGTYESRDDFNLIPLRAGVQHFVYNDKVFLYAETGAGIGFFPYDLTGEGHTKVNLSYAAGGGYNFRLKERNYLQGSLNISRNHYNSEVKFTWLTLRVTYGINWNKK